MCVGARETATHARGFPLVANQGRLNTMKCTPRMLLCTAISCVSMLLAPVAISGDIYTWTDENGVKHFGARPPIGERNAKLLKKGRYVGEEEQAESQPAQSSPAVKPKPSATDRKPMKTEPAPVDESASLEARESSLEAQVKRLNCEKARSRLDTLNQGGRFRSTNEQGESIVLTEEEVQRQIEQAKQIAADSC